ncbi:MAG: IPTL-CTERM sorting domain-containing protein [Gammaproteobacteria bacterium]|nr:IPTL-CTERM sorting domain-containing protein [Gammaproteobacteria bacterium]
MTFMLRILLTAAILTTPVHAVTSIDLDNGATGDGMVLSLIDAAAPTTFSNVQYTGANSAAGTFSGGLADGFEFDSGIMLSTGTTANAAGPNNRGGVGFSHNNPGDTELDTLTGRSNTSDAAVLEFDFEATGTMLSFEYIFASEEYNEYVGTDYNDVFGFFLDGQNVATVSCAPTNTVSINTINKSNNPNYFNNNDYADFNNVAPFGTQFDGFTIALTAQVLVTPGTTYTLKLAIQDVEDSDFDSAVFIRAGSFTTNPDAAEIEVLDSGVAIADGSTTAIDFGTVMAGNPVSRTFTINNLSLVDLSLSGISNLPAGFSQTGIPATVAGCGSTSLNVQLDAAVAGVFDDTLSIDTNDTDKNPFDFRISGTVTAAPAAEIAVLDGTTDITDGSAVPVNFGTVTEGDAAPARTFTVNNTGTVALTLGNLSLPTGFSLVGAFPANVAAGGTESFQVQMDSSVAGAFSGVLSFDSNDGDENPFDFAVSGTVNAVPVVPVPVPTAAQNIPTLSEWTMILLTCLLLIFGMFRLRRLES